LDQATSEITSAQSQLEDERSSLGGEHSELEDAKLAADQAKAQGVDLAKRAASLKSQIEKANVNDIWSTPGNTGPQTDLVASYVKVGDFLMAQGNLAQALNGTGRAWLSNWLVPTACLRPTLKMPFCSTTSRCLTAGLATC
jgi:hypothetical protein